MFLRESFGKDSTLLTYLTIPSPGGERVHLRQRTSWANIQATTISRYFHSGHSPVMTSSPLSSARTGPISVKEKCSVRTSTELLLGAGAMAQLAECMCRVRTRATHRRRHRGLDLSTRLHVSVPLLTRPWMQMFSELQSTCLKLE